MLHAARNIHHRDKNLSTFVLLKDGHWEEVEFKGGAERLTSENLKGRKNK